MPSSKFTAAVFALLACLFASESMGSSIAYTDAGATAGGNAGNLNIGREFTVGAGGITVLDLGVYDSGSDGLVNSHDVTLFSITGSGGNPVPVTELATTNVPNGTTATLDSGFRFEAITPIFLAPGNYSVVVYGMEAGGGDPFGNGGGIPSGLVTHIGFDPFQFTADTNPAFPINGDGNNHSSTSFHFNPGNTTPEPSTLVMLGLGALGLLLAARRHRAA